MFFTGKKGKQCLYHLYLETVSITNTRSQQLDEDCENDSDLKMPPSSHIQTFTPQDYETIADFITGAGSDVFRQILHSICPSIFGHEMVKGEFSPTQNWKCVRLLGAGISTCSAHRYQSIVIGRTSEISNPCSWFFPFEKYSNKTSFLSMCSWHCTGSIWRCTKTCYGQKQGPCQRGHPCDDCR